MTLLEIRSPMSLLLLLTFVLVVTLAMPTGAADLGQIPVRLALNDEFLKLELNKPATVTVTVKNAKGATVPAIKEERVQIRYQGQVIGAVIPSGQSSVSLQITSHAVGIDKLEVTGQTLAGVNGFVQCIDSGTPLRRVMVSTLPAAITVRRPAQFSAVSHVMLPIHVLGGVASGSASSGGHAGSAAGNTPSPPSPAPPSPPAGPSSASTPPSTAAQQTPVTLKVIAQPEQVTADETGTWSTRVVLALLGEKDELVAADADLTLIFSADHGQVQPLNVTLKKDQSSTFDAPVTVSSNWTGETTLTVMSKLPPVQQIITYISPPPKGLRLEATPAWVTNDGKSAVQIQVMLVAADKSLARALADTEISLSSTRGTIPLTVKIAKGEYASAPVTLTSVQNGVATVTAQALGLQEGQISASFLFPWVMMIMGSLGGLLGAFAHNPKAAVGSHWWRVLALGLIFGAVLSIAALLGVIGSLPKLPLPIEIAKIPSFNTAGALLLGFIGGYYGKKLWKGGDNEGKEKAAGQPA